jgi:glycosyltransferase involved in cell wall biosynthesis
MQPKPKLLVVGPTYNIAINRQKLVALSDYFSVTCAASELGNREIYGMPDSGFEQQIAEPIDLQRFSEWPNGQSYTRIFYLGLSRLFRSRRFDIVLVESEPWAFLKWQTWWLTRRFQRRAAFGEFSWENVERTGFKGFIVRLLYRASVRVDDFTISGNLACRQIFLKYGQKPERNLLAAQLGVDPIIFRPVDQSAKRAIRLRFGIPPEVFLIGYCGRLIPEKGVTELFAAAHIIRERLNRSDIHLALLGDGPLAKEFQYLAGKWIHLLASRPHFEIPPFMQALDLFVLPSKPLRESGRVWEEQFGHVLIEAMACGVPAIGSDSGAIPEVIGQPDAVFHHSSKGALANILGEFIQDSGKRERLASGQFQRVQECFSQRAVAGIYTRFLLTLLAERPNWSRISEIRRESGD